MNKADTHKFAELAQDFYEEKQRESEMITPIKKAWAANEDEGMLIIVSCFGKHSRALAGQCGIPWKGEHPSRPSEDDGWCYCKCHGGPGYQCQTCIHCQVEAEKDRG